MDNNTYLNFFFEAIKNELFFEREKITKISGDKALKKENIELKTTTLREVICKIKLEDSRYLLINDLPLNFLIFFTITIGDRTKLISYRLKEDAEFTYISTKEVMEKIEDKVDKKTLRNVEPLSLRGILFQCESEMLQIIKSARENSLNNKKVDLSKIHITNSDKIELFLPTVKNSHLALAKKLKLDLRPIIKNNFIRESSINVYDVKTQIDILKPIISYNIKKDWEYDKVTGNKIFHDLSREIFLKLDLKILEEKLNLIESSFPNISKVKEEIERLFAIQLSSYNGKIPLPLWRTNFSNQFLEINSEEDFEKLSGRRFKLDEEYLNNIYLIDSSGKEALIEPWKLNLNFEEFFEKDDEFIEFESYEELYIKLLCKTNVKTILKKEKISKEERQELINITKKICRKVVKFCLSKNKVPRSNDEKSFLDSYFISQYKDIENKIKERDFRKISTEKLLIEIIKTLRDIEVVIYNISYDVNDLFLLFKFIYEVINVIEEFDKKTSNEIREYLNDYIKLEFNEGRIYSQDSELVEYINACALSIKVSKNTEMYLDVKKDFPFKILKNYTNIGSLNSVKKTIVMDPKKIAEKFPRSHNKIIEYINNKKVENVLKDGKVVLNDRSIKLSKKDFFKEIYIDPKFKKVLESNYFDLYLERTSN